VGVVILQIRFMIKQKWKKLYMNVRSLKSEDIFNIYDRIILGDSEFPIYTKKSFFSNLFPWIKVVVESLLLLCCPNPFYDTIILMDDINKKS
jgi:hypothetical protein